MLTRSLLLPGRLLRQIPQFWFSSTIEEVPTENHKISKFQIKSFCDRVRLTVQGGHGGSGSITFFTDKRVRRGAPDGGDGGEGGNIEVEARRNLHDLSHLRLNNLHGNDGRCGRARGMIGKAGGRTLLHVPCGTLVYELVEEERNFITFLESHGDSAVLVRGGAKGKGNKVHFGIADTARYGKEGEKKIILLEMKVLADVGLVGLPNVGKSTFLAASTRALPKIANYDFTTLKPSVGHVRFVDNFSLTITDIPGIIEDAHLDKGLGLEFLRHIERTKVLLFVVDITRENPLQQWRLLEKELLEYKGSSMKDKERVVIFNKADCLVDSVQRYNRATAALTIPHFLISAKEGEGLGPVLLHLRTIVEKIKREEKRNSEREAERMIQENIRKL